MSHHIIHLRKLFEQAWILFKTQFGSVLILSILLVAGSEALARIQNPVLAFLFSFVSLYFSFAFTNISLNIAKGNQPQFDQLLTGVTNFLNYLLASFILVIIAVIIGFAGVVIFNFLLRSFPAMEKGIGFFFVFIGILCALFLFVRLYLLLPFFILDKGSGPVQALKQSWNTSKQHTPSLLGFIFAASALWLLLIIIVGAPVAGMMELAPAANVAWIGIGGILFVIGMVVLYVVVSIARALLYRQLTQGDK